MSRTINNPLPMPQPDRATVSIIPCIEERARRIPDSVAVRFEGRQLTYRELLDFSDAVAAELLRRGCAPEDRIGVLMPRCLELVPTLLGILRAGACYLALEPTYPATRIAWMMRDAGVRVVCGTSSPVAIGDGAAFVDVSALEPATHVSPEIRGAASAYMLYTSGSTGQPKGVINTHEGLWNRLRWMHDTYEMQVGERVLQKTPFTFDVSVWEFFWPLMAGGVVVLAPQLSHRDFASIAQIMDEDEITRMHFVPSVLEGFLNASFQASFPHLRQVVCSGEALPTCVAQIFLERYPHVRLDNLYGPTEAAIDVSHHRCIEGEQLPVQPIGLPISGIRLAIVDEAGEPCGTEQSGELLISGIGLARGYHGRPALTAARFVPCPTSGTPGARAYRTGDLARARPDGVIDFLGRLDFQLKINGQRIEPAEIERSLREFGGFSEVVVVDRTAPSGRRFLVAYGCLTADAPLRRLALEASTRAWSDLYELAYQDSSAEPVSEDFRTWTDSFHGGAIDPDAMRLWADEAAARIVRQQPRSVLEIGCGSGLIALRIAASLRRYVGVDPSPSAIGRLREALASVPDVSAELFVAPAHELPDGAVGKFDAVVLNSVVQYFPDEAYLSAVMDQCVALIDTGHLLLGDIRDLRLLGVFAAVRAQAIGATSVDELRALRDEQLSNETELCLDPNYFLHWAMRRPRVLACEFLPKTGAYDNELARYRFDVLLHIGAATGVHVEPPRIVDWDSLGSWDAVLDRLREPESLRLSRVPLKRLAAALGLSGRLDTPASTAVDGHSLLDPWEVATRLATVGMRAEWRLDLDRPDRYSVTIVPLDSALIRATSVPRGAPPGRALHTYPLGPTLSSQAAPLLKRHLAERLPPHTVPEHFVMLHSLPLNSSGKIDRASLPSPLRGRRARVAARRTASTPTEKTLADIWSELLKLDEIDVDTTFLSLGGDSILQAQMAIVASKHGLAVSLALALAHPTLRELARALDERVAGALTQLADAAPDYSPDELRQLGLEAKLKGRQVTDIARLPEFTAGMLAQTLQSRTPGVNFERLEFAIQPTDIPRYLDAWAAVIRRHELLRSAFSFLVPGKPAQIVTPDAHLRAEVLDWRALSLAEQQRRWTGLCNQSWSVPLPLDEPPLMRLWIATLPDGSHRVLWLMHHSLTDGWVPGLLLQEVQAVYRGEALCEAEELPRYSDVASEIRRRGLARAALPYWRQYLADSQPGAGRTPSAWRARTAGPHIVESIDLPAFVSDSLRHTARKLQVTMSALFEAAWALELLAATGAGEARFGCVYSTRSPELRGSDTVVGAMMSTLPVRTMDASSTAAMSFSDFARSHFEQRRGHLTHAHVDLGELQCILGLDSPLDLFESLIVFENIPLESTMVGAAQIRYEIRSTTPIVLIVWPGQRYRVVMFTDTSRVDAPFAHRALASVVRTLRRCATDGEITVGELLGDIRGTTPDAEIVELEL